MNKKNEKVEKKVEAKKVDTKKVDIKKLSSFKKKKKVRKNIVSGIAYVYSTFNNTIISIADESGNVVSWSSAGSKGFKGSRKSTPYAAQVAADDAGAKAYEQGLRTLTVQVKDQDQVVKLPYDHYSQEDLKFYQLRTLRLCHTMVQDHPKEGEYNANDAKCYRQKLESFNKTK